MFPLLVDQILTALPATLPQCLIPEHQYEEAASQQRLKKRPVAGDGNDEKRQSPLVDEPLNLMAVLDSWELTF
jgi:hypothetical protein